MKGTGRATCAICGRIIEKGYPQLVVSSSGGWRDSSRIHSTPMQCDLAKRIPK